MMPCRSEAAAWLIISVSFGLAFWIMPVPFAPELSKNVLLDRKGRRNPAAACSRRFNSFKHITGRGDVN
jgi:hypothetical protein